MHVFYRHSCADVEPGECVDSILLLALITLDLYW